MNEKLAEKKVKYIASIIYLVIFSFIVGGTYINQTINENQEVSQLDVLTP